MISAILASVYISFVCWIYGAAFLKLLTKSFASPIKISPVTNCFTGLALIGILFTALSLFIPLGTIQAQFILLLPAVYFAARNRKDLYALLNEVKSSWQSYTLVSKLLLLIATVMVLAMHAAPVNHPDTLYYHAQNIQWIEKYPAVPGTINLSYNYGVQSSWFVLSALFSFRFTGTTALTYVNVTVLSWFIFFVIHRIDQSYKKKVNLFGILWVLLLIISFWSYTQIRLTASSASPDFIAVLYIWLTVYLFITIVPNAARPFYLLLILISFFTITIKVSALPIFLLSFYAYYSTIKNRSFLQIIAPFLIGLFVMLPFLARNVIGTGYLLFPSSVPNFFQVDWKGKKDVVDFTQQYITAYARTNSNAFPGAVEKVVNMKVNEWLPTWWSLRSWADKTILLGIPILLVINLFYSRKTFRRMHGSLLVVFLFALVGSAFWFLKAPDPRFGFGYLIPLAGSLLYFALGERMELFKFSKAISIMMLIFSGVLGIYSIYRFKNFFPTAAIIQPRGITMPAYTSIDCNGIKFNRPIYEIPCGNVPLPCVSDCDKFQPRGKKIEEGFRSR